jgi:hypothetical protein
MTERAQVYLRSQAPFLRRFVLLRFTRAFFSWASRGVRSMQAIRIPEARWGEVWRTLVASGAISCIWQEPIYLVSDRQVRLLRRKKLPFEVVPPPDGRKPETAEPGSISIRSSSRPFWTFAVREARD